MKKEFYFKSSDGKTDIHAVEWVPEGEPKAILQLCHGMAEYIERYHDFAEFLTRHGFYVIGHDHLGHGKTVTNSKRLGYFHEEKGNEYVLEDIHRVRKLTEEKYPHVPYFIMGHSMGSFLVRQYLGAYRHNFAGAIIMGTGDQPNLLLGAGQFICKLIAKCKGWDYRSKLVHGMAAGGYNKRFQKETDTSGWLSRNPETARKYGNDPLCGYMFTVNGYYHMFRGMLKMNKQEKAGKIVLSLPIFFVAGYEDPVGDFGKGVEKVYERYQDRGMRALQIKLYDDARHEILNDYCKEQVYGDLLAWLEKGI